MASSTSRRLKQKRVRPIEDPMQYGLHVHNRVTTARLNQRLNIQNVAEVLKGRYAQSRFPSANCNLRVPTVTFVIFANATVQVVGPKSIPDAILAIHILEDQLRMKMCCFTQMHYMKICNVVCSISIGHRIDLGRLAADFPETVVYNKHAFEGAHFHLRRDPTRRGRNTMAGIFRAGRLVITGARDAEEHRACMRYLIPICHQYRIDADEEERIQREDASQRKRDQDRMDMIVSRRRVWIEPPAAPQAAFYFCRRGVGGCFHEKGWTLDTVLKKPKCVECDARATLFRFALPEVECEHKETWTNNVGASDNKGKYPMCDSCGKLDTSEDQHLYKAWIEMDLKRTKRKRRREEKQALKMQKAASSSGVVQQSSRRKRFKPRILRDIDQDAWVMDKTKNIADRELPLEVMPNLRQEAEKRFANQETKRREKDFFDSASFWGEKPE